MCLAIQQPGWSLLPSLTSLKPARSCGWLTSPSTTYLYSMRCHQIPPEGASRPHETMEYPTRAQVEPVTVAQEGLIRSPSHSILFVSADASGMFLLRLLRSKRKHFETQCSLKLLSSKESRGGPCFMMCILSAAELSWCISVVCSGGRGSTFMRLTHS